MQVYREHADRGAARVVRQPVPAQLSVRPPVSCARGCGTCASWLEAVRHRSDARVRRRGFGRAGGSRTRRSPRCPGRSAACQSSAFCASAGHSARRGCGTCASGERRMRPGLWLRCGAACDRTRTCGVLGSAVQVYREHADRRATRVVRPPVQSRLTVRPPGTCARKCGTCASGERRMRPGLWLDAVRHAIGCACAASWVRPCRNIENTPIAALPMSFGDLPELRSGCACRFRAPFGRAFVACAGA